MLVCPSCGQDNPSGFRFCGNCGAPLALEARVGVRKVVTILFCDVAGSTALGEGTDPEALQSLLAHYFARMKAIVERHGGTVEKFIGDAVMAVFGIPAAHEDDALRAVRAASEMRAALPEVGVEARIGVNTGEVMTGTGERLAAGDAVNVAARLEQAAAPGEILIGASTAALARGAVETEAVEPLTLKGKAEPVDAYRLVRVLGAPERRHETPFVGRERELALLRDVWEEALRERRCELITIVADAGIGKSRVVAELVTTLDARLARGRCLPYGEGITYWPVVEVVKQLGVLPPDEAAARVVRSLLGEEKVQTSADEIAWAVRKTLEHASQRRPLVVVFDDIQWGEETFLDLVEQVALLAGGAAILLVCIARPELLERRPQWPVTLRLQSLPPDAVDELIPPQIAVAFRERIARAAGGNPLFITEILAMAGDGGDADIVIPPTLQALLTARLDQLEPLERSVLERGAVEGEIFHRGAVQALASEETQVTPRLAALVRKELIRPDAPQLPGEDAFRFRHLLIRDAAYDALPKATRAELHERFALWLEEHGTALVELDEIVGYHLESAIRYRRELGVEDDTLARSAAARLATSAQHAFDRGDMSAASNLFERAAALLPPSDPERLKLLPSLGRALVERSEWAKAEQLLVDAIAASEAAGERLVAAKAALVLANLQLHMDPTMTHDAVQAQAETAQAVFEEFGDDAGLAGALHLQASLIFWKGNCGAALDEFERAVEHARRAGSRADELQILRLLITAILHGPTPVPEALERLATLLSTGVARGIEIYRLHAVGLLHAMQGQLDAGRKEIAEAAAIAEELGFRTILAAGVLRSAGELELMAGDLGAAERALGPACQILQEIQDFAHLASLAPELADVLVRQGRDEEAALWMSAVEGRIIADDVDGQVLWRRVRAKLLTRQGEADEAERPAREAVELAARTDYLMLHAGARADLAEVLEHADRKGEAREQLEHALALHEQKGNIVMQKQTKARIAELED